MITAWRQVFRAPAAAKYPSPPATLAPGGSAGATGGAFLQLGGVFAGHGRGPDAWCWIRPLPAAPMRLGDL